MPGKSGKQRETQASTKDSLQAKIDKLHNDREVEAKAAEGPVDRVLSPCKPIVEKVEAFRNIRYAMIDVLVVLRDLDKAQKNLDRVREDAEEHEGEGEGDKAKVDAAQKEVDREREKLRGPVEIIKRALQSIPSQKEDEQMKTIAEDTKAVISNVKSLDHMVSAVHIIGTILKCFELQLQMRGWELAKQLRRDLDWWKGQRKQVGTDEEPLTDLDVRAAEGTVERVKDIHRKALGLEVTYKKNKSKDPKSMLKNWIGEMTRLKDQLEERSKKR